MDGLSRNFFFDTDGVHADTCLRDPDFIMSGHHCHSCCELFYVETGECRLLLNDNIFDLHAGDFALIPPMELHYTRYLTGPCRRTVIFFRDEDILPDTAECLGKKERLLLDPVVFQVPEAYRKQINEIIRQMTAEEKISDEHSPVMRLMLLQTLFLLCNRVCRFFSDSPVNIHTTDRQILQTARYISEHYMHSITTAQIARSVGFSPNHLSRRFRQATGIGLHEYTVFVRLHHAAQELVSTEDSITTIALRCGFSSSNYFKDCFKKKYGVTPRTYRNLTLSSS